MKHFGEIERAYQEASVLGVYEFIVDGKADVEGILLRNKRWRQLTDTLKRHLQPQAQGENSSGEDRMEEFQVSDHASGVSVDTDVDTEQSESASSEDATLEHVGKLGDADGAPEKLKRPPLWSNSYFYIVDNAGHPDVKVRMYNAWATQACMGHHSMSKALTPSHFGETRADPRRSFA